MPNAPRLATAMRYRDVEAAVDWLCRAFGFEKQAQSTSDTGEVVYAQLGYGNAVLMLAPVRDTVADRFMKQPDEIGGVETQSCYFAVADADAHWARAKEAGARIVLELQDDDAGGRGYSCRDPEGHIWSFGTHDPTMGVHAVQPEERPPPPASRGRALAAVVGVVILLATGAAIWTDAASWRPGLLSSTARQAHGGSVAVKAVEPRIDETAERAAREAREELERERAARRVAEEARRAARDEIDRALAEKSAALQETSSRVAEAQRATSVAEQDARGAREELERTRAAKVASDQASEAAQQRLADQDASNKSAGAALERVRQQLAEAERAREAAECAAKEALERAQQLTDAQQSARETADRTVKETLEPVQRQLAEAQSAREAAERSAKEAREQLTREQSAKNAAWLANAQLRRQLGPGQQATSETGAAANDGTTAAGGPPRARPKGKAKPSEPAE